MTRDTEIEIPGIGCVPARRDWGRGIFVAKIPHGLLHRDDEVVDIDFILHVRNGNRCTHHNATLSHLGSQGDYYFEIAVVPQEDAA